MMGLKERVDVCVRATEATFGRSVAEDLCNEEVLKSRGLVSSRRQTGKQSRRQSKRKSQSKSRRQSKRRTSTA